MQPFTRVGFEQINPAVRQEAAGMGAMGLDRVGQRALVPYRRAVDGDVHARLIHAGEGFGVREALAVHRRCPGIFPEVDLGVDDHHAAVSSFSRLQVLFKAHLKFDETFDGPVQSVPRADWA